VARQALFFQEWQHLLDEMAFIGRANNLRRFGAQRCEWKDAHQDHEGDSQDHDSHPDRAMKGQSC
jgi:hypothetical protein